ncbi:unnamed protein product [Prunus armeniaca]
MVRAIRPFHRYKRHYFRQTLTFITIWPFQWQHTRTLVRRLSSAARLGRNGQTPRSSGPVDKAEERGAKSSAVGCGPARSAPLGAPIRRRLANDGGQPGSEAPGGAKVYQTVPAKN